MIDSIARHGLAVHIARGTDRTWGPNGNGKHTVNLMLSSNGVGVSTHIDILDCAVRNINARFLDEQDWEDLANADGTTILGVLEHLERKLFPLMTTEAERDLFHHTTRAAILGGFRDEDSAITVQDFDVDRVNQRVVFQCSDGHERVIHSPAAHLLDVDFKTAEELEPHLVGDILDFSMFNDDQVRLAVSIGNRENVRAELLSSWRFLVLGTAGVLSDMRRN